MSRSHTPLNTPTYLRLRNQIRDDIEAGHWQLGQHLTLGELSNHYSVSNVPVREALLQLQGEGLVDMRMNRGAVVLRVDGRYIEEFHDIRAELQAMLVRRACVSRSVRQLARAQVLAEAFETATRCRDPHVICAADGALHEHVNQMGRNDQAVQMLESRSHLIDAFRRSRCALQPPEAAFWLHQNRALLAGLESQQPEMAVHAVREHVASLRRYMLQILALPEINGGPLTKPIL